MIKIFTFFLLAVSTVVSQTLPSVSLVLPGTTSTVASNIMLGTGTFSLDLRLDTGGRPVSTLDVYITVAGVGGNNLTYSGTPIVGLSSVVPSVVPFAPADIFNAPTANGVVDSTNITNFFKQTNGDYPAGIGNVATYTFNTSTLPLGVYIFTPTATSFSNSVSPEVDTFGPSGSFTLAVIPEPATAGVTIAGFGLLAFGLVRRKLGSI